MFHSFPPRRLLALCLVLACSAVASARVPESWRDDAELRAISRVQRTDVLGDVVPIVKELGVRLDQPDQLIAAHRLFSGRLLRVAGDQAHDVVVIDRRRGEEDELEIELIDGRVSNASRRLDGRPTIHVPGMPPA